MQSIFSANAWVMIKQAFGHDFAARGQLAPINNDPQLRLDDFLPISRGSA
jgi:hypothetical protein